MVANANASTVPAPLDGPILVVHSDRKLQRALHRILGATLHTVDVVDNVQQGLHLLGQHAPALLVMDHRDVVRPDGEELIAGAARQGTPACLVLTSGETTVDLPRLFTMGSLTNLLASHMPILAEELTVTALKLLRRDIFGLEKYMAWGIRARSIELANARDRSDAVDAMARDVRQLGLGARIASVASLIADELLSNALYNAPIDAQGERHRAHESRHSDRPLRGREQVTLRYGCDARYLAIEVTDRFGSIERETVLGHLAKCARTAGADEVDFRRTGAGVGLGLVYSSSNHLVFNLHPGHRTEVIALVEVRFTPAELGNPVSSFNVFVQDGGAY